MKKNFLKILSLIAAFGLLSFLLACEKEVVGEYGEGRRSAPGFTLPRVDGGSLSLSDFKEKVIILDFWATWCSPCIREIPNFIDLYDKYKDKGLVIIGISVDRGGINNVRSFCEDIGINYPVVMASEGVQQRYGGIRAIPTTFIIDRNGIIVNKHLGYTPPETFEAEIKKLIQTKN